MIDSLARGWIETNDVPVSEFLSVAGVTFARNPLLIIAASTVLFLVFSGAGKKFGIPDLLFSESIFKRGLNGFCVAAVMIQVALALLLLSFRGLHLDPRFEYTEPYLMLWLLFLIFSCFPILTALRLVSSARARFWRKIDRNYREDGQSTLAESLVRELAFPVGIMSGFALAVLGTILIGNLFRPRDKHSDAYERLIAGRTLRALSRTDAPGDANRSELDPQTDQSNDRRAVKRVYEEYLSRAARFELNREPSLEQNLDLLLRTYRNREPGSYGKLIWSAIAVAVLYFGVFLAFSFSRGRPPRYGWLTPVAGVLSLLSFIVGFQALVLTVSGSSTSTVVIVGIVCLAAALMLGSIPKHKYRARFLCASDDLRADLDYDTSVPLFSQQDRAGAQTFKERVLDHATEPSVFVCSYGGGSKAAAWTLAVLKSIELAHPRISQRIKVITGASGGMVGAAYYVAERSPGIATNFGQSDRVMCPDTVLDLIRDDSMYKNITRDMLTPIVSRLVTWDLLGFFSPFPVVFDRGHELEATWHELLNGALSVPLSEFEQGEREGWRPSLIFSPMLVEDGRRLIISNLDLHSSDETVYEGVMGVDFFRLFPKTTLSVATATRFSAAFPYVSPATHLPTEPVRRVVDAGYLDNTGIELVAHLILREIEEIRRSGRKIIVIRIDPAKSETPEDNPSLWRSLRELTGPLRGFLEAHNATETHRNDALLESIKTQLGEQFSVVTFRCDDELPLSWYLSEADVNAIVGQLGSDQNKAALSKLARVFN